MNGRTHALTALALASSVIALDAKVNKQEVTFAASMLIGGLIPDVDNNNSMFSNSFAMAHIIYNRVKHRGFIHTIECALLVAIPFLFVPSYGISIGIGLFFGYLSHLFLDCFNQQGIMLFYPFTKVLEMFGKIQSKRI